MRYILLIYSNEEETATPEELGMIAAGHGALMQEAARRGIFRAADPLQPTATATTVRLQGGKVLITDGPFAETKEQLAGYYILECENLDEALAWASKIPTACKGAAGCVEVRPLREIRKPEIGETAPAPVHG
jgi:hypothetical protein